MTREKVKLSFFYPTVKSDQVAHEMWICFLRVAFILFFPSKLWKKITLNMIKHKSKILLWDKTQEIIKERDKWELKKEVQENIIGWIEQTDWICEWIEKCRKRRKRNGGKKKRKNASLNWLNIFRDERRKKEKMIFMGQVFPFIMRLCHSVVWTWKWKNYINICMTTRFHATKNP